MKKIAITLSIIIFLSCSKANDAIDTLDSIGCLNELVRLSQRSEDLSCTELTDELLRIERSCNEFFDEDARASYEALRALCNDSN